MFLQLYTAVNSAVKKSVLVLLARHKCVILLVEFVDQFVFQERKPRTRNQYWRNNQVMHRRPSDPE